MRVFIDANGKVYKAETAKNIADMTYAMDQSLMESCLKDNELITMDEINQRMNLKLQGVDYDAPIKVEDKFDSRTGELILPSK